MSLEPNLMRSVVRMTIPPLRGSEEARMTNEPIRIGKVKVKEIDIVLPAEKPQTWEEQYENIFQHSRRRMYDDPAETDTYLRCDEETIKDFIRNILAQKDAEWRKKIKACRIYNDEEQYDEYKYCYDDDKIDDLLADKE
jgi:ferredoxin-thioredoxin reductase catalytic subunit